MGNILDRTSFFLGWLAGRAVAQARKKAQDETAIAIDVLAATFDPLTAETVIGESGTLGGESEFVIGYTGQPIHYSNGHLIIEDVVATETTTADGTTEERTENA